MTFLASRQFMMILYSDESCPESHCTRLVLAEKNINFELHSMSSDDKQRDVRELNPYNELPILVDRDLNLFNTHIIIEYLDERYPHPPLMLIDPISRGLNRLYRYRIKRDLYCHVETLQYGSDKKASQARKKLRSQLIELSALFSKKPYFMSEEYSLIDCYLAPLLWRLPLYGIDFTPQMRPLSNYAERLFKREAFKESLSEIESEMHL
jgi:RNA polymerase-associated protein